jgi:hypothetical protein
MPSEGEWSAGGAEVRRKPHPIVFSGALGFTSFVALVVTLLIRHNDLPASTDWRIVAWGGAIAASGWIMPLLRWRRAWIELDGDRLRWASGRWRVADLDVDLGQAGGLAIEQSWLGRLLDYAHLRAVDAAGAEHHFPAVSGVEAFRRTAERSGRRGSRRTGRRG